MGPSTTESVPAQLMSTASGFVVGIGEIFGGGIAPSLAGYVAHNHGIQYTLLLAIGAMAAGLLITLAIRETAPVRVASVLKTT